MRSFGVVVNSPFINQFSGCRQAPEEMLIEALIPETSIEAAKEERETFFFTLEYTEKESLERLHSLDNSTSNNLPKILASDDICADFIVQRLANAQRKTIAVIDYLQILDQKRSKPPLSEQLQVLQHFARDRGMILGFISQIDRSFDPVSASVPSLEDIRLPNPIPEGIFTKTCFLHSSEIRLQHTA